MPRARVTFDQYNPIWFAARHPTKLRCSAKDHPPRVSRLTSTKPNDRSNPHIHRTPTAFRFPS